MSEYRDGFIVKHEDAQSLIRYNALGARVTFVPMRTREPERSRGYQITLHRHGAPEVCVTGSYSLPVLATQLAASVRDSVAKKATE